MARYKRIPGGEKNDLTGLPFTRKELEKVGELYIQIDGKGIHENNPKIHDLATTLERTIRSVENQLLGFRSFVTKKSGRVNYNSLIPEIWNEINNSKENNKVIPEKRDVFDEFKFRISSQIKTILGKNLITDDFVAVFEIVKNSFDAHAKKVKIIFEKDKITIWDDGKGMNRRDIIDKWLFLAYSAKNEGVEDIEFKEEKNSSYRDRINPNRSYAGAKGIGRLGCDRLGSKLEMTTRKINDSTYWNLKFDWDKYEVDALEEFGNIEIKYSEAKTSTYENFENGLILEISNLRNVWSRPKIIELKKSLAKLINPFTIQNEFSIEIICQKELDKDNEIKKLGNFNPLEIVNGEVKNFVFNALNIATTQIKVAITEDEEYIETELIDRGNLIYKIKEPNKYKYIPAESNILLFYLNTPAKLNFKKIMGINSAEFGSIFLFNNGFRVLPFGEPNNDPFNINVRKGQGRTRYLGSRELIGQVVISKNTELFLEASSRDAGFVSSSGTAELQDFFMESLKKLEYFVVPILWKISKRTGDNEEVLDLTAKNQVIDFVGKISGKKDIQLVDYSDKLVNYITENTVEQNLPLFDKLREIALRAGDNKSLSSINKEEAKYKKEIKRRNDSELKAAEEETKRIEAEKAVIEERRKRKVAEDFLEDSVTENLFLKSVKSQDFEEIISFIHHIGISSSNIDNYLTGISKKLTRGIDIDKSKLNDVIKFVLFENKKVQNITRFATKANFKLYTDAVNININEYIKEYINNILLISSNKEIEVELIDNTEDVIKKVRPIELNILIDNLLSNSKKALASKFIIKLDYLNHTNVFVMEFIDNGIGISENNLDKLFNMGYTTTEGGAGIGLFHVKEIVDRMDGEIEIKSKTNIGTQIIIKLK